MKDYFDAEKFNDLISGRFPTNVLPDGTQLTKDRTYTLAMSYIMQRVSNDINDAGAEWDSYIESKLSSFQSNFFIYQYDEMEKEAEKQGLKTRIIRRNLRKSQLKKIDSIFKGFFEKQLEENGLLKLQDIYSIYIEMAMLSFDDDSKKFSELGQALTMILLSGGIMAGFWPNSPGGVWPDGNLVVYWPHKHQPEYAKIRRFD